MRVRLSVRIIRAQRLYPKDRHRKNLVWTYDDGQNTLEITVNLSKPEKNNKDIAKLLTAPQSKGYPACALCKENEGFEGQGAQAPRQNIRTVKTILGGEPWFVQYSPYAYYDEHCIAISEAHTPMNVNDSTVEKVLDFVDAFPNYFIGSNASLPIIGGSILNHEHFQGGRHEMPMHRAEFDVLYEEPAFPDVRAGILDWYNSAFQLESENRASVAALAKRLIAAWKNSTALPATYFRTAAIRRTIPARPSRAKSEVST